MLHVHWLVPMILYVLVAFVGVRWALKTIVGLHSRTKRLFLQYLFCSLFAIIFAVIMGHLRFNTMTVVIIFIGFLNGFACYANWKATEVSLSKTSLMTFWDDLIAMGFSWVILNEGRLLSIKSAAGIALCLLATLLFALHAKRGKESLRFFGYVAVYSVLWGIAQFFENYGAKTDMPAGRFLSSWYVGALIASCFIVLLYKDADKSQQNNHNERLRMKDVAGMFLFSFVIASCLAISYWVFLLAPQLIVQPVFLIGEAVVPAIVGWIVFKEKNTFDKAQWGYSAIGLLGVIMIAFGF